MSDTAKCELCGEPMPVGEEMFKFHGYSGACPKPPLQSAPENPALILPAEMTPAIKDALSFMNFQTGPIAHALRAGGEKIARKCEDEQAHVLFWFLKLAIAHGDGWREQVRLRLKELAAAAEA